MRAERQLPLPLPRVVRHRAVDFVRAPSNEAALTWLDRTADWPQGRLALWGEPGCGKTHLLQQWAAATGATCLTGATLPRLDELSTYLATGGFAVDDADAILGEAGGEEARLLHLLNAATEARLPVLLAARTPPARWPVALPDLASRLRAVTAVEILPPDDMLLRLLLVRLFAEHQHMVPEPTRDWLLVRLPRTPAALRAAVERLDRASLGRAGGITLPLAREVLGDLLADEPSESDTRATGQTGDQAGAMPAEPIAPETTTSSASPSPPTPPLL
jgi:chromosomal replication initiation ATPase DnaA